MKSTSADITRKDFKEAILRLYKTTPFKDITVRKLCETAGYNRSTFYLHYKDIIDLLHEIDDDLLQYLWENIAKALNANTNGKPIPEDVKHFFSANLHSFIIMFQADEKFQEKLLKMLRKEFQKYAHSQMDIYRAEYTISAAQRLFTFWLEQNQDLSVEQLLELVRELDLNYLTNCDCSKIHQPDII